MARRTIEIALQFDVKITISDDAPDDVLTRCFTEEWQENFYRFSGEHELIEHLAYNASVNGVEDASRLEGWADLSHGMLTMEIL